MPALGDLINSEALATMDKILQNAVDLPYYEATKLASEFVETYREEAGGTALDERQWKSWAINTAAFGSGERMRPRITEQELEMQGESVESFLAELQGVLAGKNPLQQILSLEENAPLRAYLKWKMGKPSLIRPAIDKDLFLSMAFNIDLDPLKTELTAFDAIARRFVSNRGMWQSVHHSIFAEETIRKSVSILLESIKEKSGEESEDDNWSRYYIMTALQTISAALRVLFKKLPKAETTIKILSAQLKKGTAQGSRQETITYGGEHDASADIYLVGDPTEKVLPLMNNIISKVSSLYSQTVQDIGMLEGNTERTVRSLTMEYRTNFTGCLNTLIPMTRKIKNFVSTLKDAESPQFKLIRFQLLGISTSIQHMANIVQSYIDKLGVSGEEILSEHSEDMKRTIADLVANNVGYFKQHFIDEGVFAENEHSKGVTGSVSYGGFDDDVSKGFKEQGYTLDGGALNAAENALFNGAEERAFNTISKHIDIHFASWPGDGTSKALPTPKATVTGAHLSTTEKTDFNIGALEAGSRERKKRGAWDVTRRESEYDE